MAKMILKDSLINLEGLTPNEVYLHSQALNFYKKCKRTAISWDERSYIDDFYAASQLARRDVAKQVNQPA